MSALARFADSSRASREVREVPQAVGGRLHQWRVGRQRLLVSLFETGEQIERGSYFFIVS
jgi:hypothetical protein